MEIIHQIYFPLFSSTQRSKLMPMDILRQHISTVPFFHAAATRSRIRSPSRFNVRSLQSIFLQTKSLVFPLTILISSHFDLQSVRANLPFPKQNANYFKELEAAVDVVQRACNLCLNVMFFFSFSPIFSIGF